MEIDQSGEFPQSLQKFVQIQDPETRKTALKDLEIQIEQSTAKLEKESFTVEQSKVYLQELAANITLLKDEEFD